MHAAFAYCKSVNLNRLKNKDLIIRTWDDKKVFFLGVITRPQDGSIKIANCECVMSAFSTRSTWPEELVRNVNWFFCKNDKCCSVCCEKCYKKTELENTRDCYKCIFPCKNNMMYCKYNDEKKRVKREKKIADDTKSCDSCKTTLRDFCNANPFCDLMTWTQVPKNTDKL